MILLRLFALSVAAMRRSGGTSRDSSFTPAEEIPEFFYGRRRSWHQLKLLSELV